MSKNIVIFNKKGGVGKSTLATNLAVEYSNRIGYTTLVDLDVSQTSLKFMNRRADSELMQDKLSIVIPNNNEELDIVLEDDTTTRIYDVGGFQDEMAINALMGADLLVVPVSDSPQDKDTTMEFIKTLQTIEADGFGVDTIFVMNNTSPQAKFENLAKRVDYIREAGYDLYGAISHYAIFSVAHGSGMSVCEINEDSKASKQLLQFITGVKERLNDNS